VYFALEGMNNGSPDFFNNKPAIETIQALEDSIIIYINVEAFEKLCEKYTIFFKLKSKALEKIIILAADRIHFFTVLSPEERFIKIQKEQPDLVQRVEQKHLASYLGITTVSLSRIKSRLLVKKK
jgi:CRP-like cAMP-binding protein